MRHWSVNKDLNMLGDSHTWPGPIHCFSVQTLVEHCAIAEAEKGTFHVKLTLSW